jgi:hypothetical protein
VKKKKMSEVQSESVFELVVDVSAERGNNYRNEYGEHKLLQ